MRTQAGRMKDWKAIPSFHHSIILSFLLSGCFIFLSIASYSSAPTSLLDSANAAYSKGNFEKAVQQYEEILTLGYEAPEVYFNLGNAYYKTDNIGRSILNYERAKKRSPHDEDILFNMKLANQRTMDKIEPLPDLFLEDWWENLKSMQSERTWGIRCIACIALFFFFLGVFITSGQVLTKQIGFWLSIVFFAFAVITFTIARSKSKILTSHDEAVILSPSAEIKNAPTQTGTKLFLLHEGTVVTAPEVIINPEGEWIKVIVSTDKVGWVKRSALEFI